MNSHEKHMPILAGDRNVVGIDLGKTRHVAVGVATNGKRVLPKVTFTSDRAGIDRLEERLLVPLGGPPAILVAMEATGHYWMSVYEELQRRDYSCVVINPIQTRAKNRTRIRKTGNDDLDADSLVRLIYGGEARASRVPEEPVLELRLLTRYRWRLLDVAGDLTRSAHSIADRLFPEFGTMVTEPFGATGRAIIKKMGLVPETIATRRAEFVELVYTVSRGRIDREKAEAIADCAARSIGVRQARDIMADQLRDTVDLIEAIEAKRAKTESEIKRRVEELDSPLESLGLSAAIIATIHAESDPITDFRHPWQYAAFTGLDPSSFKSADWASTRTPISKRGSPYLRRALYLATLGIYKEFTDLERFYLKQRTKGRHHTGALVAVTHKFARIVWRLLTDNRPFRRRPPRRGPTSGASGKE